MPRAATARVAIVDAQAPRPYRPQFPGWESVFSSGGPAFPVCHPPRQVLLLSLAGGVTIVIHPMLAGRIRYGEPLGKDRVRDALILALENGKELRYHDTKDMGKIYLVSDLDQVPGFAGLAPEADDPALTLETFRQRLRKHQGEIKGVLTNQQFVAGIGNVYADEILWCAAIYPMRRRASSAPKRWSACYRCMQFGLAESHRHPA